MRKNFAITPDQEAILNTYTCQRLTADPRNQKLIRKFRIQRNRFLAEYIQSYAWEEDTAGLPAVYYVVKNSAGEIAMIFSLKCATLCDPSYVAKVLLNFKEIQEVMDKVYDTDTLPYLKQLKLSSAYWDASDDLTRIKSDKRTEPNRMLMRVEESYPAIELVHFCVNDRLREEWNRLNTKRGMGEVFFWKFVVPKMLEISQLIGGEYACLFAADTGREDALIRYYQNVLHFEQPSYLGGIKPYYDFSCIFMCKRLRGLSEERKALLEKKFGVDLDPLGLEDYRRRFFDTFNQLSAREG